MSSGYCKVRGTSHVPSGSDVFRPKDRLGNLCPFIFCSVQSLEECLSYVKMGALYYSVSAGAIAANPDMLDKIFLLQMPEHGDEGFTIIRDDLDQSTPSAEYVLKDPIAEGLCGLFSEHSELGIMSE